MDSIPVLRTKEGRERAGDAREAIGFVPEGAVLGGGHFSAMMKSVVICHQGPGVFCEVWLTLKLLVRSCQMRVISCTKLTEPGTLFC